MKRITETNVFLVHDLTSPSCLFKPNEICSGAKKKLIFLNKIQLTNRCIAMYCTWYMIFVML